MHPRDILKEMLEWIAEEQRKANIPGGDPFVFMSLAYCASKSGAGGQLVEVMRLLHITARVEPPYKTYDAMGPYRAIFLINRTLATCG